MEQLYGGHKEVISISVSAPIHGGKNATVEIDVSERGAKNLIGEVPEINNDVPVKVSKSEKITPDTCSAQTGDDYSLVDGGVRVYGETGWGTLTGCAFDNDGNKRFATCNHLFEGISSGGEIWHLYHPDTSSNSNRIGEDEEAKCADDIVFFKPKNNHSPQRRVKNASPEAVNGQWEKDGLADIQANEGKVKKMGAKTCETTGDLHAIDATMYNYGCIPHYGQLKYGDGNTSNGGDSGGPVYHVSPNNSDYQWIAGINNWSNSNVSGGTSSWRIKRSSTYHF
ncbi:hypothetical protein [Haloferax larsenii]|uniref:Trypsin n=1 Tax=Haloferax larsenii TaxID=302484 RepID=A0A1H7V6K4_HALLR|nr:hypothetical protein [Haloferax larsenii]SEM04670.1 hypothetical protein SAMN04488691_11726 [Haloferax larsenii]